MDEENRGEGEGHGHWGMHGPMKKEFKLAMLDNLELRNG